MENLTTEQGLSNNTINDLLQDDEGFLWIATSYGLNCYDGTEVVQYLKGAAPDHIPGSLVYCLERLDSTHILIGTDQGLALLDIDTRQFRHIHLLPKNTFQLEDDKIMGLSRESNGNIWAATSYSAIMMDKQLNVLDTYQTLTDLKYSRKLNIYSINPLPDGSAIFFKSDGQFIWEPTQDSLQKIQPGTNSLSYEILKQSKNSQFLFRHNLMFSFDRNQLFIYDFNQNKIHSKIVAGISNQHVNLISGIGPDWISISPETGGVIFYKTPINNNSDTLLPTTELLFPDTKFSSWMQDMDGNLWARISTGGLWKVAAEKQMFNNIPLTELNSNLNITSEVTAIDRWHEKILIGTYGSGFYINDSKSNKLTHYLLTSPGHDQNLIWNFLSMGGDTIWIGTQEGLFWWNMRDQKKGRISLGSPKTLNSVPITTLFRDSRGDIWIGLGNANGVTVYHPQSRTFTHYPSKVGEYPFRCPIDIGEDKRGDLWFISDITGNLVKWDHNSGLFLVIDVPKIEGKIHSHTYGFYLNREKDEIWYGVESIGLVCYHIFSKKVEIYGDKWSLGSRKILGITPDKFGRYWLSTTQGLGCFNPVTEKIKIFSKNEGLPEEYYTSRIFYDSTTNRIYAGTPGYLTWCKVTEDQKTNNPLRSKITGIYVNQIKRIVNPHQTLSLSSNENNILITFTGINLGDGSNNRYQYKLNNGQWMNLRGSKELRFPRLTPGDYYLQIRAARQNEGYFSPSSLLHFTIKTPFTKSPLFFIICTLVLCGITYGWYRYRINNFLKIEKIRARISRDLHDEIGSKITNIGLMSQIGNQDSDKPGKSDEWFRLIRSESESISESMREIIWSINPSNDSLEKALPRMIHYATSLLEANNLIVHVDISLLEEIKMSMEERQDLYLIFKEAIQNIIRHANATDVWINIHKKASGFKLIIKDNGSGYNPDSLTHKNGLLNMKERAVKHHWSLYIGGIPGEGAKVSIEK